MAFKMTPGRSPLQQTGRGIPSAFLQTRTTTTVNPVSGNTTKEQAAAEAKKKAEQKLAESVKNKPLEGTETRSEEGSASYTIPGRKVERFAKTPAEIAAWKKAPKENKDKYKDVVTEVKETASGQGKIDEIKEEDYGNWFGGKVEQKFGSHGSWGYSENTTDQGTGYKYTKVTPEESKIQNSNFGGNSVNPYDTKWSDYGTNRTSDNPDSRIDTSPGSGEKRRQEYIKSRVELIDTKANEEKIRKNAVKEKDAAKLVEINKRKAAAEADRAAKKAAVKAKNTPLNQKIPMATENSKKASIKQKASPAKQKVASAAKSYKTPAKMKKC